MDSAALALGRGSLSLGSGGAALRAAPPITSSAAPPPEVAAPAVDHLAACSAAPTPTLASAAPSDLPVVCSAVLLLCLPRRSLSHEFDATWLSASGRSRGPGPPVGPDSPGAPRWFAAASWSRRRPVVSLHSRTCNADRGSASPSRLMRHVRSFLSRATRHVFALRSRLSTSANVSILTSNHGARSLISARILPLSPTRLGQLLRASRSSAPSTARSFVLPLSFWPGCFSASARRAMSSKQLRSTSEIDGPLPTSIGEPRTIRMWCAWIAGDGSTGTSARLSAVSPPQRTIALALRGRWKRSIRSTSTSPSPSGDLTSSTTRDLPST
ncbi:hypothetical protein SAMN02745121_08626 [Nannocystis exedens]|uniref:Uncharacterized protein n=1 Tax=Nannocystis exedens TaxID=54 RepID=A0A1I2IGT3_9BACT|nr:hypothetical protein NAEX_01231 [Nannocystis exedens]SFF40267.1 hypothetical protein SAMN02745121_08626 [Nannocystis exedens]